MRLIHPNIYMSAPLGSSTPTAKRSPLILVTDARSHPVKGARAPFAGHSYKQNSAFSQDEHQSILQRSRSLRNKFTDISVDKLLMPTSDIPLGQSRLPSLIKSTLRRSIPKLSLQLPARTSKNSQRLVLIPERSALPPPQLLLPPPTQAHPLHPLLLLPPPPSRAELMPKDMRAHSLRRLTAYFICDQFDITLAAKFLRDHHGVKPRLYDEALYVPYTLPLLPGTDSYRVRTNNSAKLVDNSKHMESLIIHSEQSDHLYEYYLGVETIQDATPENADSTPFDPLEPQFFSPPEENGDQMPTPVDPDDSSKHHAEMFMFEYGIVVFWNFEEAHEKNILADLAFADKPLLINPIPEQDIETEEFHFDYDPLVPRPRIYNDMITLRSGDHLIKLTMSHAIAQLTKLCLFELRMVSSLLLISRLPKKLALTGTLGLKRTQLLKKLGKLFKLRVDVNLLLLILDTPDFFWLFEPALHPLYSAVREYLEIDQRVHVLNDRCKVFLEFADIVSDSINEKNTNRITWMIIVIIFMSLLVSLFEFLLQVLGKKSK